MDKPNQDRRKLLMGTGVAMLTLAPGFKLVDLAMGRTPDQPATDHVRWGLFVDVTKCAQGCTDCVDACNTEFGLNETGKPETNAQYIRKLDLTDKNSGKTYSLPMLCQHCDTAPCVDVCPTGASFKRDDGVVLVDKHTCIGCRYCMMACPYKARSFVHENLTEQIPRAPRGKGTVESCNFCVHRIDRDRLPACVEACTQAGHGALVFGDMQDKSSEVSAKLREQPTRQVRADLGLNTAVRYHGV